MKISLMQTKSGPSSRCVRDSGILIKEVGENGTFSGYASVFGVKDAYSEIVAPGAFKKSLAQHRSEGTFPAMLYQHDPSRPIGVYSEMREDEKGLFVRGKLALDTPDGKTAHALLKMGALNGLSIGFMPVKSTYDEEKRERTLTEIDLWEVSLVTFPANGKARVESVKANIAEMTRFADVERYLRDVYGVSQSEATAIVARIKEIDRKHREDAKAKSDLAASSERLLAILNG